MKHSVKGRKFGRVRSRRRSFLHILVHNLVMEEKILTTEARAKEIRPRVERLITIAKRGDLAALQLLMKRTTKDAAYKLYHELGPRYKDRNGGYTRIRKSAESRKRDGATQATVEFV